jgi:hypothetical protein
VPGPLSPSSMFDRSPLSVVVPEKNPCFYSFKSNLPEVNFTF